MNDIVRYAIDDAPSQPQLEWNGNPGCVACIPYRQYSVVTEKFDSSPFSLFNLGPGLGSECCVLWISGVFTSMRVTNTTAAMTYYVGAIITIIIWRHCTYFIDSNRWRRWWWWWFLRCTYTDVIQSADLVFPQLQSSQLIRVRTLRVEQYNATAAIRECIFDFNSTNTNTHFLFTHCSRRHSTYHHQPPALNDSRCSCAFHLSFLRGGASDLILPERSSSSSFAGYNYMCIRTVPQHNIRDNTLTDWLWLCNNSSIWLWRTTTSRWRWNLSNFEITLTSDFTKKLPRCTLFHWMATVGRHNNTVYKDEHMTVRNANLLINKNHRQLYTVDQVGQVTILWMTGHR